MRRRAGWIAFALIGCGRIGFDDVPSDASIDAIDTAGCFGSRVKVCFDILPREPVMLDADTDIDTDRSPLCDPHNDRMAEFCVVAGIDFTIQSGAVIRGHGKKPLVLLAMDTIDVKGAIDVSSDHGAVIGAGADPDACASGQLPVNAGGGHGGSFRGRGGRGKPSAPADLAALAPDPLSAFPPLRGGCPGASGSTVGGAPGGRGGSGGGAVAFVARMLRIQVGDSSGCDLDGRLNDGCVDASGAAGLGGPLVMTGAGGGGGGTGGMIVLDAMQIQQRGGKLLASGGGGGEGGGPSVAGVPGEESKGPGNAAAGGRVAANDESGDGADGSTGSMLDGGDAVDGVCVTVPSCGGGGGGGGGAAGFIYAPVFIGGQIDPPSANP